VDLSRRTAAVTLGLLVAVGFGLRIWSFRVGLPHIFHSDFVQVDEAAELLEKGSFAERSSYPVTHVYAYAGADLAAYAIGRVGGRWKSWREFVSQLAGRSLQHEIARAYTAAVGSLIAVGVYLLARQHLSRRAALFAAGMAAFSPVHVIYAHQARIHVPGITLLAFAAIPVARLVRLQAGWRTALAAGAACGATASVFQLGYLLAATAGGLLVLRRRTWMAALSGIAVLAAGFAAVLGALWLAGHLPGAARPATRSGSFENVLTLGIPTVTLGIHPERFPGLILRWALAEPMVAVGSILFLVTSIRSPSLRPALLAYGLYPVIAFATLGTNYEEVRYSMSVTPFLAVLAGGMGPGVMNKHGGVSETRIANHPRFLYAALALAVPLAQSLRFDSLLDEADTRVTLQRVLGEKPGDLRTAVQAGIYSHWLRRKGSELERPAPVQAGHARDWQDKPPGVEMFPPDGDFRIWRTGKTPEMSLEASGAVVFVLARFTRDPEKSERIDLPRIGFRKIGEISPGRLPASALPDAPDYLIPDLWLAHRPGPRIEIWVKTEAAAEAMARIIPR
jgi:dolichyl-phosphate-mannose-protein mannosyltransferase